MEANILDCDCSSKWCSDEQCKMNAVICKEASLAKNCEGKQDSKRPFFLQDSLVVITLNKVFAL